MKHKSKHIELKMRIDENLESYQNYLPDEWVKRLHDSVPENTMLDLLVLKLGASWRCATYTAQMPSTLTKGFLSAAIGRTSFSSPDSSITQMSEAIIRRLCDKLPSLNFNKEITRQLKFHLLEISRELLHEVSVATRAANNSFDIQNFWKQHLSDQAFRLSLRDSQRSAFLSVFHAYESFLIDCLKIYSGTNKLRVNTGLFNKTLDSFLCESDRGLIWIGKDIKVFKEARNALAHNGGKLTDELRSISSGKFIVAGDELQIMPKDVKDLIGVLMIGVDAIVAIARERPEFLKHYEQCEE